MSYLTNPYRYAVSEYPNGVGDAGDGTVDGMVIDTSDQKLGDGCGSFDGSNDKVVIPTAVMNEIADGDFTISMWINRNANQDPIFGSASPYFEAHVPASNIVAFSITSNNYNGSTVTATSTWYLVIIRRTSNTITMYVDNSDQSVSTSTDSTDVSGAFNFGTRQGNNWWNGLIDDAAFFSKSISTALMTEIWNSGTGETIANLSDKEGIVAYYNFDSLTNSTLVNQAIP